MSLSRGSRSHRREVGGHDRLREHCGDARRLVSARLDRVEDLDTPASGALVLLVHLRDVRVDVPAEIRETFRMRGSIGQRFACGRAANVFGRPDALHVLQPGDDVRDLNTCVVQVVLDLDPVTQKSQRAGEHVAKRGISEVPDVCGLVGIDVRVLDDHVSRTPLFGRRLLGEHGLNEPAAVEKKVQVPRAFDPRLPHTLRQRNRSRELARDRPRRLGERLREIEGRRGREVAHRERGRALQDHAIERRVPETVGGALHGVHDAGANLLERQGRAHRPGSIRICGTAAALPWAR
jgi:hypothetical protein